MNTVDLIVRSAANYYAETIKDNHGRYRSWEHCYSQFCKARKSSKPDTDHLSLQLAFYLASWGMYRGSSFLLQKDYKIHEPVVKELLKKKYDPLVGIKCVDYRDEQNQKLLDDINTFLRNYYNEIRIQVKGKDLKYGLSDTLTTKVLMGTLACVPAYDRYFVSGVVSEKVTTGQYNINSLLKLADFYENNNVKLEAARKEIKVNGKPYPQMKLMDMGFWQIGFDKE